MAIADLKKILGGGSDIPIGSIIAFAADETLVSVGESKYLKTGFITRDFVTYPDAIAIKNFTPTAGVGTGTAAYSESINVALSFSPETGSGEPVTIPYNRSVDKGVTWTLQTGFPAMTVMDCLWSDTYNRFIAVGTDAFTTGSSTKCATSPDGLVWTARSIDGRGLALAQNPNTGTILCLATTVSDFTRKLYKSIDGGLNWSDISATMPTSSNGPAENISAGWVDIVYSPIFNRFILIGGLGAINPNRMAVTTNEGTSWTVTLTGTTQQYNFTKQSLIEHTDEGVLYAMSGSAFGLIKSSDGGDTWTRVISEGANNPNAGTLIYLEKVGLMCSIGNLAGGTKISSDGVQWIIKDSISGSFYTSIDGDYFLITSGGNFSTNSSTGFGSNFRCTVFDEYIGTPDVLPVEGVAIDSPIYNYVRIA